MKVKSHVKAGVTYIMTVTTGDAVPAVLTTG